MLLSVMFLTKCFVATKIIKHYMAAKEVTAYITKRYNRWKEYAEYHCTHAGITNEANDVLNEVLFSLLQKNEGKVLKLLHKRSGQYTELDYYVLRMIKLNATSPTSPYQRKYKEKIEANSSLQELQHKLPVNIDSQEIEEDESIIIFEKTQKVREMLKGLDIDARAKEIFEYRFFHHELFSKWTGEETTKQLYSTYSKVVSLLKEKIENTLIF